MNTRDRSTSRAATRWPYGDSNDFHGIGVEDTPTAPSRKRDTRGGWISTRRALLGGHDPNGDRSDQEPLVKEEGAIMADIPKTCDAPARP